MVIILQRPRWSISDSYTVQVWINMYKCIWSRCRWQKFVNTFTSMIVNLSCPEIDSYLEKWHPFPHPLLFIQTSYMNKKVNLLKKSRRWGSNTFERILSVKFIVLHHQILNTNASTYTPNSNGYSSLSKY